MLAPIILFAFNRPEHLHRTLVALAANELAAQTCLTIFCDGPRHAQEKTLTDAVRAVARSASGFSSCTVVEREKNYGLATSVITGVTESLEKNDQVIVLEDDLLTSPYFLRYMNDGLALYADEPKVASIHGWCFPHSEPNPPETFFLRGTDCLGWATWRRAWRLFVPDAGLLASALRKRRLVHAFNCNSAYDYMGMLEAAHLGTVSSWAVRWRASAFLQDLYTLHPGRSLVQHAGGDGSGSNTGVTDFFDVPLTASPIVVQKQEIRENTCMRKADMKFHARFYGRNALLQTFGRRLRTWLPFLPSRQQCKYLLKDLLPPFVIRGLQKLRGKGPDPSAMLRWEGDFPDWQSAVAASSGYDSDAIFDKVLFAARAVRDGKALWERDSVLFYHEEYNLALVAALMSAAAWNKGSLTVLDFGGALGSTYMQHRPLLQKLDFLSWNIVEQAHFVACGQKEFSDKVLRFWPTMDICAAQVHVDVVLFSSVLQYMEDPYALLEQALALNPHAIIIDRTCFAEKGERISIQHVPATIYPASYPCRWLDKARVAGVFQQSLSLGPWWQSAVDPLGFQGIMGYRH